MFYEDVIYNAAYAAFKRAVVDGGDATADSAGRDLLALGVRPEQLAELRPLRAPALARHMSMTGG